MTISPETLHDPGGKVRLTLQPGVAGKAVFSPDGHYRQALSRRWGEGQPVLWIGMNPSTAGAEVDDPTVRWEIDYTRKLGFNAYLKTNVMDYRATNPARLRMDDVQPISPRNKPVIRYLARKAAKIIMVYGSIPVGLRDHANEITAMLRADGHTLWCLGLNKNGTPKHPLYLRRDTPLIAF